MTFLSQTYYIFLAVTVATYFFARPARGAILLLAGFIFYLSWDWRYLVLHLAVALSAFLTARAIEKLNGRSRSALLWAFVLLLLSLFFLFKFRSVWPALGFSFYSLQALGYVIDVHLRKVQAEKSVAQFVLFTSFFPQAPMGPIERIERMRPQFARLESLNPRWSEGVFLITFGLFKKLVVSERIALLTHFQDITSSDLGGWGMALYCFLCYLELYCDFSAYTDIARGSAKLFGIDLIENFRQPYLAASPTEIWQRWHYSLVNWLQNYLYWPLLLRTRNIYLTATVLWFAVGFWHRPAFYFVAWSAYWSTVFCIYFYLRGRTRLHAGARHVRPLMILLMLAVSSFSSIFIASESPAQLILNISAFAKEGAYPLADLVAITPNWFVDIPVMLAGLILILICETVQHQFRPGRYFYVAVSLLALFGLAAFAKTGDFTFIYMRF